MQSAVDLGSTKELPNERDALAPDGSDVRILLALKPDRFHGGCGLAHFQLPPRATSKAVQHRTESEIWYFLSGRGQMWRRRGWDSVVVDVQAGVCLAIPVGTQFQFRSVDDQPLEAIGVTIPPWPGEDEAVPVSGLCTRRCAKGTAVLPRRSGRHALSSTHSSRLNPYSRTTYRSQGMTVNDKHMSADSASDL